LRNSSPANSAKKSLFLCQEIIFVENMQGFDGRHKMKTHGGENKNIFFLNRPPINFAEGTSDVCMPG
jgi:hypothetical protein